MAVKKQFTSYELEHRKYMGRKIKSRRRQLKRTQTKIANLVGVTFQQIQKYEKGGGFHKEHFERSGGNNITIKRVLFWITYLDDVPDGGTIFRYLNHTEAAVKGKTIISPCDWTHTHCGQISHTQTKMIATGWLSHLWDFQY